jgi:broad specificity phosphatase PhoE
MSGRVVWLARHGHRMDEVDPAWKRYARHPYNPDLSPRGLLQAMKLAKRLKRETDPVQHLVVSPFLRTMRTGGIIAAELGLQMNVEQGVGEMRSEEFFPDGDVVLPSLRAQREYFPWVNPDYCSQVTPSYPETDSGPRSAGIRVKKVFDTLLGSFEGNLLIVSHYAICNGGAHYFTGSLVDGYIENCTYCKFVQQVDGSWVMTVKIEHAHLFEALPHDG